MTRSSTKSHRKLRIAFDVNNTLTDPLIQKMFRSLDRNLCYVIVWSSVGKEYAQKFCFEHGLVADEYLTKQADDVDVAVDDLPGDIQSAKVVLGVESRR